MPKHWTRKNKRRVRKFTKKWDEIISLILAKIKDKTFGDADRTIPEIQDEMRTEAVDRGLMFSPRLSKRSIRRLNEATGYKVDAEDAIHIT